MLKYGDIRITAPGVTGILLFAAERGRRRERSERKSDSVILHQKMPKAIENKGFSVFFWLKL